MQLYTNNIIYLKKIRLKYMNTINSDMSEINQCITLLTENNFLYIYWLLHSEQHHHEDHIIM